VDSAVDVAKEAADIVLLEKDLNVLVQGARGEDDFCQHVEVCVHGIERQFRQYVQHGGSLPLFTLSSLLPKQILLTNLLTDFPEMTIATDSVDRELVEKPRRWNIQFIRNFMLTFGILSSVFDYLTFVCFCFSSMPRRINQNRLVLGVCDLSFGHCSRYSHPEGFLQK